MCKVILGLSQTYDELVPNKSSASEQVKDDPLLFGYCLAKAVYQVLETWRKFICDKTVCVSLEFMALFVN